MFVVEMFRIIYVRKFGVFGGGEGFGFKFAILVSRGFCLFIIWEDEGVLVCICKCFCCQWVNLYL